MDCPICHIEIPPEPLRAFDEHWATHIVTVPPDDGRAVHRALKARAKGDPEACRRACRKMDREAQRRLWSRAAGQTVEEFRRRREREEDEKCDIWWNGETWVNLDLEET